MNVDFGSDQQAQRIGTWAQGGPRIVSVASGKGGVGKTFVSTSIALVAAGMGRRVLLVDGDLSLANVDVAMGLQVRHHLGEVLNGTVSFHEAVVHGPQGLSVLPASAGVAELAQMDPAQQQQLLQVLRPPLSAYDLVIIDCGAGVGDSVVFFGRAAHESLVVMTPEPTALADAYATIKVLATRANVGTIDVIVNQASEHVARDVFRRLSGVVGRFLPTVLRYQGSIPLDDSVRTSVLERRPLLQSRTDSAAARAATMVAKGWLLSKPETRVGLLGGM
jgi:flagellar biosynthesis protein FlhG